MIPILVGAAVGLAGAALLSGDNKSNQPPETEKRQVSQDYAMRYLNRAGKHLQDDSSTAAQSDDFSEDFARIENMLVNPNVNYVSIKNELESIRLKAKRRHDDKALNFVAYYRDKLSKRR